jgi:hypothetical protein
LETLLAGKKGVGGSVHTKKIWLLIINILGGIAVLGSYVYGFQSRPDAANVLWGGVPESLRPLYTANMFLAAAGYFAFSLYLLRLNPDETRVAGRFGYGIYNILYAAILIPSALWMPLTLLAIEQSSPGWVWLVRLDLAAVAFASLGLLIALLKVSPRPFTWHHRIAVVGALFFCLQTVLLDAIVWVSYF